MYSDEFCRLISCFFTASKTSFKRRSIIVSNLLLGARISPAKAYACHSNLSYSGFGNLLIKSFHSSVVLKGSDSYSSLCIYMCPISCGKVNRDRVTRYRFTLAHEIGHIYMHKELYESEPFKTTDEWKDFIRRFPKPEYDKFEWQAYAFAGLILAPSSKLETIIDLRLNEVLEAVKKHDINLQNSSEYIWDTVYEMVGHDFEVSPMVINKRVDFDKIKQKYKL